MAIRFTDLYGFTIPDYYIYLYSAAGIIQMKMGCDLSSELLLFRQLSVSSLLQQKNREQ